MIVEYSREHKSLIFASTENLCVDLLWQLEFIHMFNTCPITMCVTWRHKENYVNGLEDISQLWKYSCNGWRMAAQIMGTITMYPACYLTDENIRSNSLLVESSVASQTLTMVKEVFVANLGF